MKSDTPRRRRAITFWTRCCDLVADRLALTSAAVWRLATLEPTEQKDLAYRFAEPGLLDDKKDLDQFVAQAFETEKPHESLVAELILALQPALVNGFKASPSTCRGRIQELRALDADAAQNGGCCRPLDFRASATAAARSSDARRRASREIAGAARPWFRCRPGTRLWRR